MEMNQISLSNLLKYCLRYMRLTSRRSYAGQDKFAAFLDKETFDLSALLASDINESRPSLINLPVFYSVNPNELKPEMEKQYRKEKLIAEKIDEIYNPSSIRKCNT